MKKVAIFLTEKEIILINELKINFNISFSEVVRRLLDSKLNIGVIGEQENKG